VEAKECDYMSQREDEADFLDAALHLEASAAKKGLKEGLEAKTAKEAREGRSLGLAKGSEVGSEVGFYAGFSRAWLALLRSGRGQPKRGAKAEDRALKALTTLLALVEAFPEENVADESAADCLREARGKFRMCCALLDVKEEAVAPRGISW